MTTEENKPLSTRNLIDTSMGPLRRFTGILASMPKEPKTYENVGQAPRTSIQISLNVRDIDVLESVEPYHFPIYTIQINESDRKKSRWGVLGESFNNVVDSALTPDQLNPTSQEYIKPQDRMDIPAAIEKKIGFVVADGIDGRPEPPILYNGTTDAPTPAWMVYSVDGAGAGGGSAAMDDAITMLDGKTQADFNTAAMANARIRSDVDLLQAISKPLTAEDSFINILLNADPPKFTKDENGVYHKVEA